MKNKSKRLAFLLRHDGSYVFVSGGWRMVDDLVVSHGFSRTEIECIVKNDPKGRYELSHDKALIRAKWGHSIPIELGRECMEVPDTLFHGTAENYLPGIQTEGIKQMNRQFVHLTDDRMLALNTGKRHGNPVVLIINSKRMKEDGVKFWK